MRRSWILALSGLARLKKTFRFDASRSKSLPGRALGALEASGQTAVAIAVFPANRGFLQDGDYPRRKGLPACAGGAAEPTIVKAPFSIARTILPAWPAIRYRKWPDLSSVS